MLLEERLRSAACRLCRIFTDGFLLLLCMVCLLRRLGTLHRL
jgi:hypothetical protein